MRLRIFACLTLALVLLASGFFLCSERLPRVTLPGGRELRILKVSFGTKHSFSLLPGAKAYAAEVLPSSWHQIFGLSSRTFTTPHESLVVWIAEVDVAKGAFRLRSSQHPEVLFTDDVTWPGRPTQWGTNIYCLTFSVYPRTQRFITFRIRGRQNIAFRLKNTGSMKVESWIARPLPQTNLLPGTELVLKRSESGSRNSPFYLGTRALHSDRAGWTQWRLSMEDQTGNWLEFPTVLNSIDPPKFPWEGSTIKLAGRCSEYIPVGMTPLARADNIVPLMPNPRAHALGVQSLYLLGPGEYTFHSGTVLPTKSTHPVPAGADLIGRLKGTNWLLDLRTAHQSLLLIYTTNSGGQMRGRLRERRGRSRDGKVFHPLKSYSATNLISPAQVATLIPMFISTDQPSLEVEVIATHPEVEFFLDSKLFPEY